MHTAMYRTYSSHTHTHAVHSDMATRTCTRHCMLDPRRKHSYRYLSYSAYTFYFWERVNDKRGDIITYFQTCKYYIFINMTNCGFDKYYKKMITRFDTWFVSLHSLFLTVSFFQHPFVEWTYPKSGPSLSRCLWEIPLLCGHVMTSNT